MKRWCLSSRGKPARVDGGVLPWGEARGLSGVPSRGGISTRARLVEPTLTVGLVCGKKGPG